MEDRAPNRRVAWRYCVALVLSLSIPLTCVGIGGLDFHSALILPLFAVTLVLFLVYVRSDQRRLRREERACHSCPVCGYDIRATPQRCPECGQWLKFGPTSEQAAEQLERMQ